MESKNYKILAINPGSTSTKISYFNNDQEIISVNLKVPMEITAQSAVWDQYEFREKSILDFLNEQKLTELAAVVGRGGLLRSIEGGVYAVNDKMIIDARSNFQGEHVSNLGCVLAFNCAQKYSVPSFTVDPVSVDEFCQLAYYSGHPEIKRHALSHTLNIHAIAYRVADKIKKEIKSTNQ